MHLDSQLVLSLGQVSSEGVKPENEDSIGIRVPQDSQLITKGICAVIADGVSAAEAGKQASETCVTNFLSDYFSTPETWTVKKSAHQVLIALNRWLYGQGQRYRYAEKGYVCTLSIAVFKSRTAHLFHVGDSRIYRLRAGEFEQLTRDHATRINQDQAYLTRAMGLDMRLDVDYRTVDLDVGDIFLLTTDGIHDYLPGPDIHSTLSTESESTKNNDPKAFEALCQQLIKKALTNGSTDNLSCQIIKVENLPFENHDDIYHKLTELPFPPSLSEGMVLDDYVIEQQLYASTRSQLYRVTDKVSGQTLVMKTPSVNFEDDPAYIERFIMESWIGCRIDNPHVVKVVEPQRVKTCLYYLTQYIDGATATQWVEQYEPSNIAARVQVIAQIVKGIRAMHRKETLHQDIKPDNILVDAQGLVRIIDFGSCYVGGIAEIAVPIERDLALGTADYSSPESVLGKKLAVQSDIFSLAVLSFQLLTGHQPFHGKLENCRTLRSYSNLTYVPSYHYNPHVPLWMDGALKKSMSISPELRYQDVSEFLYDLQHPNPSFTRREFLPLIEKNPLRFWQMTALILIIAEVTTLVLLL